MRIGLFVPFFPQWSETFIVDQATDLIRAGHRVDVICLAGGNMRPGREPVRANGVSIDWTWLMAPARDRHDNLIRGAARAVRHMPRLPALRPLLRPDIAPGMKWTAACAALGVIAAERPVPWTYDVIQVHFGPMGVVADALRELRLLSGPLLVTFHGSDVNVLGASDPERYRPLFQRAERFIANSGFLRERLIRLGAAADRTIELPIGVDLATIEPESAPGDGRLRILTVARLSEEKGLESALRALGAVRNEGIDFTYTVIGEGPRRKSLERLVADLGLTDRVDLAGARPAEAVRHALASHDLFILPAVPAASGAVEAQGRSLLEAQAAGLPVVASRIGGIPETVGEGAGLLTPPGDVDALSAAILRLIRDPDARRSMGERGRRHVEEHYDQRRIHRRLEALYASLAAPGSAPADSAVGGVR